MRYGNKTRLPAQVSGWLNEIKPWYSTGDSRSGSSGSATVTADATAHVKGAWVELIASNSIETSCLNLYVSAIGVSNTLTATLLDIGVGSSGNEVAVIENIAVGGANPNFSSGLQIRLPIRIFAGDRISARIQSVVTGGKTAGVSATTLKIGETFAVPTSLDVLGADTSTSQGIRLSSTAGAYVEIVSSTTKIYNALIPVPSFFLGANALSNGGDLIVGVGASGSEIERNDRFQASYNTIEQVTSVLFPNIFLDDTPVPSGQRLAVKSNIASQDRLGVVIIGVPA